MQIKNTMRCHFTPVRMALLKRKTNKQTLERMQRKGNFCLHYWWDSKLAQPLRKAVWSFLRKFKTELTYNPGISGYLSKNHKNTNSKRYMKPNVHCNITINSQDMETSYIPWGMNELKQMWYLSIMEYYPDLCSYKRIKSCCLWQHGWAWRILW